MLGLKQRQLRGWMNRCCIACAAAASRSVALLSTARPPACPTQRQAAPPKHTLDTSSRWVSITSSACATAPCLRKCCARSWLKS